MPEPTREWQCFVAPSLGALEGTPEKVWGTTPHFNYDNPSVFFGLYGLPDFYFMWRRKTRRAILWAGSDILHFIKGYWLDEVGQIRLDPEPLARWINANCESYVENGVEHEALMGMGIESKIVPSFMGNASEYDVSYKQDDRPKVYLSVSGDNFAMYGWELIEQIADRCEVDFHLYGNVGPWESKHHNVFVHGRVPKEQMNAEIKDMQCGLRPLEFDGFSEILAKSILWGQWPISFIAYPCVDSYQTQEQLIAKLNALKNNKEPNLAARRSLLLKLNKYPWNAYEN